MLLARRSKCHRSVWFRPTGEAATRPARQPSPVAGNHSLPTLSCKSVAARSSTALLHRLGAIDCLRLLKAREDVFLRCYAAGRIVYVYLRKFFVGETALWRPPRVARRDASDARQNEKHFVPASCSGRFLRLLSSLDSLASADQEMSGRYSHAGTLILY